MIMAPVMLDNGIIEDLITTRMMILDHRGKPHAEDNVGTSVHPRTHLGASQVGQMEKAKVAV